MLRAEKKQKRLDAAAAEGRWVHKVIRVFIEEIPQDVNSDDYEAKTLTEYGQQGWQLAGVLSEADESVHIFYLQKKIVPEKINPPKGEQAS
ncbi:MAG TPA: hypothetical protein VK699_05420 [Terriglobales bacterium]|nr:hypothetical protein [Terriglobales bacterium]